MTGEPRSSFSTSWLCLSILLLWVVLWGGRAVFLDTAPTGADSLFPTSFLSYEYIRTEDRGALFALWSIDFEFHPPLPFLVSFLLAAPLGATLEAVRFIASQLSPVFHLINETGGVAHLVPDYQGLIARGTEGYRQEAAAVLSRAPTGSPQAQLTRATQVVCHGLEDFAEGYRQEALAQARREPDPERHAELETIARENGFKGFRATVLRENKPMIRVFEKRYPNLKIQNMVGGEKMIIMDFDPTES